MFIVAIHTTYKNSLELYYGESLEKVLKEAMSWFNFDDGIKLLFSEDFISILVEEHDFARDIATDENEHYLAELCDELKNAYRLAYPYPLGSSATFVIYDTKFSDQGLINGLGGYVV